jgi:Zn-dependent M16 (insulinase) family peptidase
LRVKLDGPEGIRYLQDLLRESVLNNTHRAVVTMSPDADFLAKQTAVERSVLGARLAAMSAAQRASVQVRADALVEAQSRAQEVDVLPTLRRADIPQSAPPHAIRDLDVEVEIGADAGATSEVTTKGTTAKHAKASSSKSVSVPLQFAPQPTNGVVYLKTSLDISALRPEFADDSNSPSSSSSLSSSSSSSSRLNWAQWDLIPMLTQLAPSIATRHRSAEQLAHDTNRFTGGISLAATILPGAFDLSRRRHAAAAAANGTTISAPSDQSASAPSAWPAPRTHLALSSHALRRNAGDMLALCAEVMAEARVSE